MKVGFSHNSYQPAPLQRVADRAVHEPAREFVDGLSQRGFSGGVSKTDLSPAKIEFVDLYLSLPSGGLGFDDSKSEAVVYREILVAEEPLQGALNSLRGLAASRSYVDYGRLARRLFERLGSHHPNPAVPAFVENCMADKTVRENESYMALVEAALTSTDEGGVGFRDFTAQVLEGAHRSEMMSIGHKALAAMLWHPESREWAQGVLARLEELDYASGRDFLLESFRRPDLVASQPSPDDWRLQEFGEAVLHDRSINTERARKTLEGILAGGGGRTERGFEATVRRAFRAMPKSAQKKNVGLKGLRRLARTEMGHWAATWEAATLALSGSTRAQTQVLEAAYSRPATGALPELARQVSEGLARLEDPEERFRALLGAVRHLEATSGEPRLKGVSVAMMEAGSGAGLNQGLAALQLVAMEENPDSGVDIEYGEDFIDVGEISIPVGEWVLVN